MDLQLNLDPAEIFRRAIKYFLEGLAVALAGYFVPTRKKLATDEIFMIAMTAAVTFAILDTFSPSIGGAARVGSGFGFGAHLAHFPA